MAEVGSGGCRRVMSRRPPSCSWRWLPGPGSGTDDAPVVTVALATLIADGPAFRRRAPSAGSRPTGLHGIQLLALLAILTGAGRLGPRRAATVVAVAAVGCTAAFAAVTAYAGRAPYDPTVPLGFLLAAGVLTTGAAAVGVLAQASPAPDRAPDTSSTPLPGRTGR